MKQNVSLYKEQGHCHFLSTFINAKTKNLWPSWFFCVLQHAI